MGGKERRWGEGHEDFKVVIIVNSQFKPFRTPFTKTDTKGIIVLDGIKQEDR